MDLIYKRQGIKMNKKRVTVDRMTWPEVYAEIEKAPIAYVPVGPQECHGAGMPMGTDMFVPEATALMAAEKTGGLVYKTLPYSFTGATNAYRGTVSIPISLQAELLKAIARNLHEQKFKAICFVSIHGPNTYPIGTAVRELFEYDRIVTGMFDPYSYNLEHSGDYGEDSSTKETAMCHAAMEFLGIEDSIPDVPADPQGEKEMSMKVTLPPDMITGYHYNHICHHQPVRKADRKEGMKILQAAADTLAENIKVLSSLAEDIAAGKDTKFAVKP
jgi:creatinine amidohydrolase/Fe(II)-dependent formamide hydrolase-like protein